MHHRHREQARSHTVSVRSQDRRQPQFPCGSEPARDNGGSAYEALHRHDRSATICRTLPAGSPHAGSNHRPGWL